MPGDREPDGEALRVALAAARKETVQLRAENERLRALLGLRSTDTPAQQTLLKELTSSPAVDAKSSLADRVALHRSLFRGRDDVFAVHWTSSRSGKTGYSPAVKGCWFGGNSQAKEYLPLTDDAIEQHLFGKQTIGLYPLLKDDRCWFLACDFDDRSWILDCLGFLEVC